MRNRDIDVIMIGFEVYGVTRRQIAELAGCSPGTVVKIAKTTEAGPTKLRGIKVAADLATEQGMMIRQAGELALTLIPPEYVADTEERSGFIAPLRKRILDAVGVKA